MNLRAFYIVILISVCNYASTQIKINELADIEFSNRASCAQDSTKPSFNSIIMTDTLSVGKSFYRLGDRLGLDKSFVSKQGIERFRYSLSSLMSYISKRLFEGSLPLIKENIKDYGVTGIAWDLKSCRKGDCKGLNESIDLLWDNKKVEGIDLEDYLSFKNAKMSCYYIKENALGFESLQVQKPSASIVGSILKTINRIDDIYTPCENYESISDLKMSQMRLDIKGVSSSQWDKVGFNFWNSLKIYLSWAMRFSQQVQQTAFPYSSMIKSVALEELTLMFPVGCKSLSSPSCSEDDLAMSSLRELAKTSKKLEVLSYESFKNLPELKPDYLLEKPVVEINDDVLNMMSYENLEKWGENFRTNMSKAKGFMKMKFIKASNKLKMINAKIDTNKLVKKIKNEFTFAMSRGSKVQKNQLYYLCSEYTIASDEKIAKLSEVLGQISEEPILAHYLSQTGSYDIKFYVKAFEKIKDEVNSLCSKLEQSQARFSSSLDRKLFHSWYQEYVDGKDALFETITSRAIYKETQEILISLNQSQRKAYMSETICVNAIDCARIYLSSLIDLHSSMKYSKALMGNFKMRDSSISNPYKERVACGVYDPWSQTKHAVNNLLLDIASAASGLSPVPIYFTGDIKKKTVASFKTLVDEGIVRYSPQYDKRKVSSALTLDFGPLLQVPCAISVSNESYNPGSYYTFSGISVNTCHARSQNQINVSTLEDVRDSSKNVSACFTCAINLQSVSGLVTNFNPYVRASVFLARGVWRFFKTMTDKDNRPRRWSISPVEVHKAFVVGKVTSKSCTKKLIRFKSCTNSCETNLYNNISNMVSEPISELRFTNSSKDSFVKFKSCSHKIKFRYKYNKLCYQKIDRYDLFIPKSCSHLIKGEKDDF